MNAHPDPSDSTLRMIPGDAEREAASFTAEPFPVHDPSIRALAVVRREEYIARAVAAFRKAREENRA